MIFPIQTAHDWGYAMGYVNIYKDTVGCVWDFRNSGYWVTMTNGDRMRSVMADF